MSSRGKISVLVSGAWLFGTANRLEFTRAIGSDERYPTFRLTKHRWEGGSKVVSVVGSQVAAWEWKVAAPAKRKKAAKPAAAWPGTQGRLNGYPGDGSQPLTADQAANSALSDGQREELAADTLLLDENALTMVCIAAGVDHPDELTQASYPAFREALAAHVAGAVA